MKIVWRRFWQRKQSWVALGILLVFALVAAAAPLLAPQQDPENFSYFKFHDLRSGIGRLPQPPSPEAPLGTLAGRMDVYYTLIWGTRSAFRFGLMVALSTATIGTFIGLLSGYAGGILNRLTMQVTDAFLAFPAIAGVWLLRRVLTPVPINPFDTPLPLTPVQSIVAFLSLDPVMLTLILFSWMPYARLINAAVLQLKQTDLVVAAYSIGARNRRILLRHLLPNVIGPAIVLLARDVGGMVILESAFTFIGLGGSVAWGVLLVTGRDFIIGLSGNPFTYWWVFLPVTLALILFGISWNLLGDALNDALNPRRR